MGNERNNNNHNNNSNNILENLVVNGESVSPRDQIYNSEP